MPLIIVPLIKYIGTIRKTLIIKENVEHSDKNDIGLFEGLIISISLSS